MFKHLLLATDGSAPSESAVRTGVHLAKSLGAKVTGLNVVSTEDDVHALARTGHSSNAGAAANEPLLFVTIVANGNDVEYDTICVVSNDPAETILSTANQLGCDLIVMGTHSRKKLDILVVGSQTQKVLNNGHLPVLVCKWPYPSH